MFWATRCEATLPGSMRQINRVNPNCSKAYWAIPRAADLVVFALDELAWQGEVEAHDLPGGAMRWRRPPGGYRTTIVNGVVVQSGGSPTGRLPGRLLRPEAAR